MTTIDPTTPFYALTADVDDLKGVCHTCGYEWQWIVGKHDCPACHERDIDCVDAETGVPKGYGE